MPCSTPHGNSVPQRCYSAPICSLSRLLILVFSNHRGLSHFLCFSHLRTCQLALNAHFNSINILPFLWTLLRANPASTSILSPLSHPFLINTLLCPQLSFFLQLIKRIMSVTNKCESVLCPPHFWIFPPLTAQTTCPSHSPAVMC